MGGKALTPEDDERILELFKEGNTYEAIAQDIGRSKKVVYEHIKKAKEAGIVPNVVTKHEHRKRTKHNYFNLRRHPNNPPEVPDGTTVCCTPAVSAKCVYGRLRGDTVGPLCNYLLCEGRPRGCDPRACTHFAKRSADNPRRKVIL